MFTSFPGNSDGSKLCKLQATPTERQATPKICVGGGSAQSLAAARRERGHSPAQRAPLAAKRTSYDSLNMPADLLYQGIRVGFRQPHKSFKVTSILCRVQC